MSDPYQPAKRFIPPTPPSTGAPLPAPPLSPVVLGYAAPSLEFTGAWRNGNRIVTSRDAALADACVKCGAPANGWRWRKKFYWHEPAYYILILFPGILIYAIVALCVRKSAKIELGLCPEHRKRRRIGVLITTLLGVIGVPALFTGLIMAGAGGRNYQSLGLAIFLISILMCIAAIITGWSMARVLVCKKINDRVAQYEGAGEQFLISLGRPQ